MNWSVPLRMNDDPMGNGVLQDLCWGSFNSEGDAIVSLRDRRNADGVGFEEESEIWATWRSKDSSKFTNHFMISDTKAPYSNILGETSGNDFMSIQMVKDTIYATWGDTRNGILNIWFERKSIGNETITAVISLDQENVNIEV